MDSRIRVNFIFNINFKMNLILIYIINLCTGFAHSTVNHEKNFKDPVTGTHTNTIEGRWFCVKRSLPRSGAYELES